MKKFLFLFLVLGFTAQAASTRIQALVTITNAPNCTNGTTLAIAGTTLMATNTAYTSSTFQTNATAAGLKTNLFFQLAAYPIGTPRLALQDVDATSFRILGNVGQALAVSTPEAGWCSIALSTNTVLKSYDVRVPLGNEYDTNRAYIASQIVTNLEDYATNRLSQGAGFMQNFVNKGAAQPLTNKTLYVASLSAPHFTNSVNHGNAFSSPGTGTSSEQFGASSVASGAGGLAIGSGAEATNYASTGIGASARGYATNAVAIGVESLANGTEGVALGTTATASGIKSMALGSGTTASHSNSYAIGTGAQTTVADQIVIGSSAHTVKVGILSPTTVTNGTFAGTSTVSGQFALTQGSITTLTDSNNLVAPAAGTFFRLSGPAAPWNICGITNWYNGRLLILYNASGQTCTIANQSGVDPAPANRIVGWAGADTVVSNNCTATLIYSATDSRWICISH